MTEISRKLASLALSWFERGERLLVREREEMRRGVAAAAEPLGWKTLGADRLETSHKDVLRLTRNGERALRRDLQAEIAAKEIESAELEKGLRAVTKQVERHGFDDPLEFTYTLTAKRHPRGLVTKTETVLFHDAAEATKAIEAIESRLDVSDRLRQEMLDELRKREAKLDEARRRLSEFVNSHTSLLSHVLATLH